MRESYKATNRRLADKVINWHAIFKGDGADIGCGDDPLSRELWPNIENLLCFDLPQGDANYFSNYVELNSLDFVHGSQVLEHMHNPIMALANWGKALKPGGFIVITVPDFYLYEHGNWPSKYNDDHKSTWSVTRPGSPCKQHIYLGDILNNVHAMFLLQHNLEFSPVLTPRLVDTNYNYSLPFGTDQTYDFNKGVECWVEFILQKTQ